MDVNGEDGEGTGKADGAPSVAPNLSTAAKVRAEDREQRRAAALRANLIRRKTQTRTRQEQAGPIEPAPPASGRSS